MKDWSEMLQQIEDCCECASTIKDRREILQHKQEIEDRTEVLQYKNMQQ